MFFFFKQKTAYEMRISDWSSDVCSSDLIRPELMAAAAMTPTVTNPRNPGGISLRMKLMKTVIFSPWNVGAICPGMAAIRSGRRSDEHTSELQSLMRISYAVFCLKKKIYLTKSASQIVFISSQSERHLSTLDHSYSH